MTDARLSRAVPFPLARGDALLRFSWSDLAQLSNLLGPAPRDAQPAMWVERVMERLQHHDVDFVRKALAIGLKTGDGFSTLALAEPDDLPFTPAEAAQPLADAILLATYGKPPAPEAEKPAPGKKPERGKAKG